MVSKQDLTQGAITIHFICNKQMGEEKGKQVTLTATFSTNILNEKTSSVGWSLGSLYLQSTRLLIQIVFVYSVNWPSLAKILPSTTMSTSKNI